MISVSVEAAGLLGPGLTDWHAALPVLRGDSAYVSGEMPKFVPEILPATERRRCGDAAKLAIHVAWETLRDSGVAPAEVASVFASSGGDSDISRRICQSLAEAERFVSPTLFHNSVHNAAAGYWSIAAKSMQSSNSLSCYDWSVSAGLYAAAAQAVADDIPVLLVCYDTPAGEPLFATRPMIAPFAGALLLTPRPGPHSIAVLEVSASAADEPPSVCRDPGLERLRQGNSAARLLPLLCAIAGDSPVDAILDAAMETRCRVAVRPCR